LLSEEVTWSEPLNHAELTLAAAVGKGAVKKSEDASGMTEVVRFYNHPSIKPAEFLFDDKSDC
jgi:hypothetical protein